MARRPKPKVCARPGCPELADPGATYCDAHTVRREAWPDRDARRPKISGWERQRRNRVIMARYGRVCHICGQPGADQVDHVVPLARNGTDTMDNLRPAHSTCHRAKTARESADGRSNQRG